MIVLVKGMEMPNNCWSCTFAEHMLVQSRCKISGSCYFALSGRPDDCPLCEVSATHGRLIDADALKKSMDRWWTDPERMRRTLIGTAIYQTIDDAPTIIPANNDAAMEGPKNG